VAGQQIAHRGRRCRLGCALIVSLAVILIAACGGDELTGSWRSDGQKGGRQLIVAAYQDSYRIAFPGTGGWLVLEPKGDGYTTTVRTKDPQTGKVTPSERFTVRFDRDLHKLVLRDEVINPDGETISLPDFTFTKVSNSTDGPPWPQ
jgi:hypothetical protein